MTHLLTRSWQTRDGKETLFDKRGRVMGKYESITDANRAARLISGTTHARPRPKPATVFSNKAKKGDRLTTRATTIRKNQPLTVFQRGGQWV